MICENCRHAAAIITGPAPPCPGRAAEVHEMYCPGDTWCDCAHNMPPGYAGCGDPHCSRASCLAEQPEPVQEAVTEPLAWHEGTHAWLEHDGYPNHQHSLNGALTIAPLPKGSSG